MHNARPCPSLAFSPKSRRPRPWLAKDLSLASDWLVAPTEVRVVSHTSLHVDLGAGAGLKGLRHRSVSQCAQDVSPSQWKGSEGGKLPPFQGERLGHSGCSRETYFLNRPAVQNQTPVLRPVK